MTRYGPRGKYSKWSGEDRIALRQFSPKIAIEEQARTLGRTVSEIRAQRRYLGLQSAISQKKLSKNQLITQVRANLDVDTMASLQKLARDKKVPVARYIRDLLVKHVLVHAPKNENNDG